MELDTDIKRLDDALEVLAEHFDSLLIFATRYETEGMSGKEGQGTVNIVRKRGNHYASVGIVMEWMERQKQSAKQKEKE